MVLFFPLCAGGHNKINSKKAGENDAFSFCTEGKTWNYTFHSLDEEGTHDEPYSYVAQGDTIIGHNAYKKIYCHKDNTQRLAFMMREEGDRVYKRLPDDEEFLFFDFGRKDIGQVCSWDYRDNLIANWMIYAIDEIMVNNNLFRRYCCYQQISKTEQETIEIGEDDEVQKDYWVKGIGSARYGIEAMNLIVEPRLPGMTEYFVSCYENGECIFTADDFSKPAYTTDIQRLKYSDSQRESLFNLQGRRLTDKPSKGIYIQNGKKVVIESRGRFY